MIPIIQFSWQRFEPAQVPNARVGQLYLLAQQHALQPFVFHDPAQRSSALIFPNQVIQAVDRFGLPFWESAASTGLLEVIRQDQMIVHLSQPATRVVRLADWLKVHTVIVTNDDSFPVGLFLPSVVAERLPTSHMLVLESSQQLQNTVNAIAATDLAGAIAAIEREHEEFHSESINIDASDPSVCEDDGRPHTQSFCPCPNHPSAPCGRRVVASG